MAEQAGDPIDLVRQAMKAAGGAIQGPGQTDRVYKEECMFSYDTPLSPGGLYISLVTWQSFGEEFLNLDHERTGNSIYLHEKAWKVPKPQENGTTPPAPARLAIGGEGGFQVDDNNFTIQKESHLFLYPETRIKLPNAELPMIISSTIEAIQAHQGASLQDETAAWEEERQESKHAANLDQLEEGMGRFGRHIPSDPSMWKCDETGVSENLWLNLSTGFIGSGRQNWDGSGGNGAAERHFEATGGRFPLAVKLGTITPHGADVFSYAENDMVTDSKLAEHLKHWGINMMDLQKTEKTMAELQINLNMSYEFHKITESGSRLQPLSGPGYVGLTNLGNSCYMNSILQMLWTVPRLQQAYLSHADGVFKSAPTDPAQDFTTQMAKVGRALCAAKTGGPESVKEDAEGKGIANSGADTLAVKPKSFKSLVGKGHPEFSTGRQQDASEYFQYLMEMIARSEHASGDRLSTQGNLLPSSTFGFTVETKIRCHQTGRVSYKRDAGSNVLSLTIPMSAAVNQNDVEEYKERQAKRAKLKENDAEAYISECGQANGGVTTAAQEETILPRVPLSACLERWRADEEVADYYSAAVGGKTTATKHNRLANFPEYLMIQLNRFYLANDWTAKKLEVLIDVPEQLDLEALRGKGLQPGELEQPADAKSENAPKAVPDVVQPDPAIVEALKQMGFSENGSKRAAVATKNGGTEVAMDWVLGHMEDANFNDPIQAVGNANSSQAPQSTEYTANAEMLVMLTSMGFTERQATAALKACQDSLERAADWLFSRASDLDSAVSEVLAPNPAQEPIGPSGSAPLEDGPGRYTLVGFVSHMGANTACGHYVCHLLKEGKWVIYNDEKVAVSEHPPVDLGYMYLYKRSDLA